jgi:transposase-like protein/IS1 family transposase
LTCHNCRIEATRNGKRRDGAQRFRCPQCGKTYSEYKEHDNLFAHKQAVDDERALLALTLIVEGNSIRSTQRITGLDKKTILRLLVAAGERCENLLASKIRNVPVQDVQCDEIWSFVYKKESRRVFGDKNFLNIGDAWTFIAIERNTKLVLAFELGRRNTGSAVRFMKKVAAAASDERFQLTTDGFQPYNYVLEPNWTSDATTRNW